MSEPDQRPTWCIPYGSRRVEGLIAQVHFATDGGQLDQQDTAELGKLVSPYSVLLLGCRVHFWCIGHTDHRGDLDYNHGLGRQRADAVRMKLDAMFGNAMLYSAASIVSLGEVDAHWPLPSNEQMAADRRVDVWSNRVPNRPPLRLPMQQIVGRLPPAIQIREIPSDSQSPTRWMPASRTDEPAPLSNPAGDRTMNHPIAILPAALQLANQASVELRLLEELDGVRPMVAWRMMDHATGGILIVAVLEILQHSGVSSGSLRYVYDCEGEFAEPGHAMAYWRRQPRLDAPSVMPCFGRIEYRFFWATRI